MHLVYLLLKKLNVVYIYHYCSFVIIVKFNKFLIDKIILLNH
jgi:hypothetical protein